VPIAWIQQLTAALVSSGYRVAIDTGGERLRALLPSQPDLCKPNRTELSEAVRRPIATVGDAHDGARVLLDLGARAVLCSLDKYGVLYVDREQAWHAWTPPVEVRSDVGAGDSSLAAFLSAADDPVRATRLAAAWGAAACRQPGSRLPRLEDIDLAATEVTGSPDRTLRLL
jgi:1-phosphofructokinase